MDVEAPNQGDAAAAQPPIPPAMDVVDDQAYEPPQSEAADLAVVCLECIIVDSLRAAQKPLAELSVEECMAHYVGPMGIPFPRRECSTGEADCECRHGSRRRKHRTMRGLQCHTRQYCPHQMAAADKATDEYKDLRRKLKQKIHLAVTK
jgi:hypothetical protein